jgi:hypothetical protein
LFCVDSNANRYVFLKRDGCAPEIVAFVATSIAENSDSLNGGRILCDDRVGRKQHDALDHCQCHQDPVKWIFMDRWQEIHCQHMLACDR